MNPLLHFIFLTAKERRELKNAFLGLGLRSLPHRCRRSAPASLRVQRSEYQGNGNE